MPPSTGVAIPHALWYPGSPRRQTTTARTCICPALSPGNPTTRANEARSDRVDRTDTAELPLAPAQAGPHETIPAAPPRHAPGGSRELLTLAAPLIVSQSFMTVQVFVDTVLLSWHDPLEMAASFPAMMWFWLPFGLLQVTAGYTSTFIAQYTGAGRPHRVGPAVWQGIHFALLTGLMFFLYAPAAPFLISLGEHPPELQPL